MQFDLNLFVKEHFINLLRHPISDSSKYKADATLLNQNENALGSPLTKWYNRIPERNNENLLNAIALVKKISPDLFLLVNGYQEGIDLLFRVFCNPGSDNVIICPPCEDGYKVIAELNQVEVKMASLLDVFQLDLINIERICNVNSKMIFIGSPNNPTGNAMQREDIELILNNFNGLVVLDETYVNFSRQKSFLSELHDYPNLIILQNFDIAWGLAGLQVAMMFSSPKIISFLNAIKLSVTPNSPTTELMLKALNEVGMVNDMIKELVQMRAALKRVLEKFPFIVTVYPSDANFLLIKMNNAAMVFDFLLQKSILVKNVSDQLNCENCLRITVGTEEENTKLIVALVEYYDHIKQ